MKSLSPSLRSRSLRESFGRLIHTIETRSASDRLVLRILFFAVIVGLVYSVLSINSMYTALTPVAGGSVSEGIVGIPRFVNPVLAVTRADQDMGALLFSGLMKIDSAGKLVPDLAESVTVSDDGKTYNIILKSGVAFSDNTAVTSRDVAFTIGLIQNSDLKSPLAGIWSNVTIEEVSDTELNIVLDKAFPPFIENLTLGILPRHIWSELPVEQVPFSQRNTEPVGSGPFKIRNVLRDEAGLITTYELVRAHNDVKLDNFIVHFYQNEEALIKAFAAGDVTATANLPLANIKSLRDDKNYSIIAAPLPRIFGIFFNQNKSPALRDVAVREALDIVIDRQILIDSVLSGYGVPTNTPIPLPQNTIDSSSNSSSSASERESAAAAKLTKAGWQKNANNVWEKKIDGNLVPLSITLRTANTSLYDQTAEVVANAWRSLGVQVEVQQYEQGDLVQAVIRPRDFEAILFGTDSNRTFDLYSFWHSSQREDPGLNIAGYANLEVDNLLASARIASSSDTRTSKNAAAASIITSEHPAIFLFRPTLTYITDATITTSPIVDINKPQDRFMNSADWHVAQEARWPLFR